MFGSFLDGFRRLFEDALGVSGSGRAYLKQPILNNSKVVNGHTGINHKKTIQII
jgi:hypothetical protein